MELLKGYTGRARWIRRFARIVKEPALFVRNEIPGDHRVGWYTPKQTEVKVGIRHGSGDLFILEEIFGDRLYVPPAPIQTVIDGSFAPRVLDLGGHVGLFALFVLDRWPTSTVTSYEPDDGNRRILEEARARNHLHARWVVHGAGAGVADGAARFVALGDSISHVVTAEDTTAGNEIAVRDVMGDLANCDFAKIDIEGSEWPLLEDPRLAESGPRAMVLEFHVSDAEPEVQGAGRHAIELLAAAGYGIAATQGSSAEAGVLWACRPA